MNIIINGRFLTQRITGVQRYAMELVKQFDRLIDEDVIPKDSINIIIHAPKRILNDLKLKYIPVYQKGICSGHLWEQTELNIGIDGNWLINLGNTAPIFKKQVVVTLHSASVFRIPGAYSFAFRSWYRLLHKILGKTTSKILTVSEFAKRDIVEAYHILPEKIAVTPLGCDHIKNIPSDKTIFEEFHIGKKPYVIAVGSVYPLKNLEVLIAATEKLDKDKLDVIIAGETNSKVFSSHNFNAQSNIKRVGHISTQRLKALYEEAMCLVHPSLYESFGLPPLEAMACGCPVIVSNATSLPEVCDNAALYFDPYNPDALAEKITMFLDDESLREEYRNNGLDRSSNFTWAKTAEKTWQVIESLL